MKQRNIFSRPPTPHSRPGKSAPYRVISSSCFRILNSSLAIATLFSGTAFLYSQAITIDTKTGVVGQEIDRRFAQISPTRVILPDTQMDARGHQNILRSLTAEQGFAMRPLPRGKKGLKLEANGKLTPSGQGYVTTVAEEGLSVKPGDRVVLSNIRIEKEKIVFDLNGGPEHKNEFLRHVQIGMGGPNMSAPIVQDDGQEPTGSRITLTFAKYVPDVTPAQIKALLAPLISFDVKTPVQAYTDTLPPKLKEAILNHHVLVGMSTDMVLYALGQPESKSREMEGQTPFEEWIYGHPPQDVSFVRVNGNRVIRVEIAKLGQPLQIFTKNEVEGLMMTDGRSVDAFNTEVHHVELGDVHRNPDTQSADAPPTLRAPGEKFPADSPTRQDTGADREGAMKPVVFPKDTTKDPARTVPAHPKPVTPPEDEDADTDSAAAKTATSAASGNAGKSSTTPPATGSNSSTPDSVPTSPSSQTTAPSPGTQTKPTSPEGSTPPAAF